jgi:hypothetical protein
VALDSVSHSSSNECRGPGVASAAVVVSASQARVGGRHDTPLHAHIFSSACVVMVTAPGVALGLGALGLGAGGGGRGARGATAGDSSRVLGAPAGLSTSNARVFAGVHPSLPPSGSHGRARCGACLVGVLNEAHVGFSFSNATLPPTLTQASHLRWRGRASNRRRCARSG